MRLEYDLVKNERNVRERGLSFERTVDFDFESAAFILDQRRNYGEERFVAIGYLDNRLHILCFTAVENGIRIISFRKANSREAQKYGKPLTTTH
ncbi:MAG: BrnT family toxin [Pseudomonadales bacterium]